MKNTMELHMTDNEEHIGAPDDSKKQGIERLLIFDKALVHIERWKLFMLAVMTQKWRQTDRSC